MDLRGQHFARATGTKPKHILSPLFLVVGQCLTLSAITSLVLFLRVDVFFYSLVGLSSSILVLATAMFVEFHEVILDPADLNILGHRPVPPRTYAAARLTNLLIYVVLIWSALNLFPAIVGAGLRDAGPWYLPAYLMASAAGSALTVCFVVLAVTSVGEGARMDEWRELFAWTQIILILVAVYGGQLMFRDKTHSLELWAAFPPEWIDWLLPGWLARFVESAATGPGSKTFLHAVGWITVTVFAATLTYRRVAHLYRHMQAAESKASLQRRPMSAVGSLSGPMTRLLCPTRDLRIGFWIVRNQLRRDTSLRIRSLLPLNASAVAVVMGLLTDQFANPLTTRDPSRIALTLAAVYFLPLAVPSILYHLAFSDESDASWVLRVGPCASASGLSRGAARAVQWVIITPAAIVFGVVMWRHWGDTLSAILHAVATWVISWVVGMASVRFVMPALPLSLPPARGGGFGPLAIPMAAFSGALSLAAGLHYFGCRSPWFWLVLAAASAAAWLWLRRDLESHWKRLRDESD